MSALRFVISVLCFLVVAATAFAQSIPPASITPAEIATERARIEALPDLPDAERAELLEQLQRARARAEAAAASRTSASSLRQLADDGPGTRTRLEAEIERLRRLEPMGEVEVDRLNNSRLRQLEDELASAEAELAALRTNIATANTARQDFAQRPVEIIAELDTARTTLAAVDDQIENLPADASAPTDAVRRSLLLARRDALRARTAELEAERASISTRRDKLRLESERDALLIARLQSRVNSLRSLTGQRLMNEADSLAFRNRAALVGVSGVGDADSPHPLIAEFGERNAELVARLEAIADSETALPRARADAEATLGAVGNNLVIATQLTELGDLDRRAGETLRRLRSTVPVIPAIEADIENTNAQIIQAGQDYLLAEEELRQLPYGRTDLSPLLAEFRRTNPDVPDLSTAESSWLAEMYDLRRATLDLISDASNSRREDAATLLTTRRELLEKSTELKATLDQNLLWLPSAEPIFSTAWPGKVVRGTLGLLSPTRYGAVLDTLGDRASQFWFWPAVAIAGLVALLIFMRRSSLRNSITASGRIVGKVREDKYLTTPLVVAESALVAAPVPLLVAFAGWLLVSAESVVPIVRAAGTSLLALSLFLWVMLALRVASDKGGLFERHIRIPTALRRGLQIETRWFIPVAATAMAIAELTHESRDNDIYEGVSVLAFMVLCVAISFFAYRLLLGRRESLARALDPEGAVYRWRNVLVALAVGVPALAGAAAAFGYFATAEEILARVLHTAALATATFIVYGMLRRTVNITHRRLSLKQILEKREAARKKRLRLAKIEAEAKGDITEEAATSTPPPVDYEQIDLEQTSRQTRQLVATLVLIGFTVLMWIIWRDLLPALGVLESVQLYDNGTRTVGEGDAAVEVRQYITLWDVVQALVTIAVTVLAARNLPGFLEVFVLNRSALDRGVKYAVTSMLGYAIIIIGAVTALSQIGVQWGQLGFIAAALGVGIGFGLQAIIANFISGIIILFERPVRVGDYVTVGDQSGTVSRIKIRATTLTDLDNKEILIPNQEFITSRVTNWTLSNSILRLIIPVGIAYGSDTKRAQEVMLKVLQDEPKVLDKPAPQAIFVNFGDSSLDFELRVFIRSFEDRFPVINAVHTAINLALEREGIGIPFPQRDLHLVTADASLRVGSALAQGSGPGGMPALGADPGLAAE